MARGRAAIWHRVKLTENERDELTQLIRQLTDSISEITHVPYEAAFGPAFEDTRRRVPDVTRAREVLDFEAQTPLEEGLQHTLEWFQDQGLGVVQK